jgi:DNA-directed RNA polymerase subunit alpha
VRAYNCLKRAQINTVADLLEFTQEDLLEIKNFGAKSAEEVIEALQRRLGITLPQEKVAKA